jgi:two-component system nitrate/nitrite response regulator NarL
MRGEVPVLTPREREVLQFAAYGRRTREIAELLNVSAGTVKTHFEHAYEKLGARDRAAAVAECLRRGLID